jgi:gliding motility-associated-like protein
MPMPSKSVHINKLAAKHILLIFLLLLSFTAFCQAPNIKYNTPKIFDLNKTIVPLEPQNAGGLVPAAIYGQVSTIVSGYDTDTGIIIDAAGNVFAADYDHGYIKKIAGNVATIFAGSGERDKINGPGNTASFNNPDALAIDANGNFYVADLSNNMIRKITPDGFVSTFAGNGTIGASDGPGTAATFSAPRGMVLDATGNIYVTDSKNNLIRKITTAGVVSTFAGSGVSGFTNGLSTTATFNVPTAITLDAAGNFYVSDAGNGAVREITSGGMVTTFATGINFPRELKVDGTGSIYIAEQEGNTVKRISPTGVISIVAGTGQADDSDGNSNIATFNGPLGLVLDGKGNLFITDSNSGRIRKVVISGYAINKALPPGLNFDQTTGIISGTPTTLFPNTVFTVTAYNGSGNSTTTVSLQVLSLLPSIITLPPPLPVFDADNNYEPKATSTNNETPITYTSSNPAVAYPLPNGLIHAVAPGVTVITAHQNGNANYSDAVPVSQTMTVVEYLYVNLPPMATQTTCSPDFNNAATDYDPVLPVTYTSSNPAVATINDQGDIHITGPGTTTITASQNGNLPLYVSAIPKSQVLTVVLPILPTISITPVYNSPCAGAQVTFTASPANQGGNPTYQWRVNGISINNNNTTVFSSNTLVNGDIVDCIVVNNTTACLATYSITSNHATVSLITPINPTVDIAPSINTVFPGMPITFTATVHNSGGIMAYQWQVNGIATGPDNNIFTSNTFGNGDVVTCTVTPQASCSTPATSPPVTVMIVIKVTLPNAFTPNGDGINDNWVISGVASYPDCLVSVYSRYGALVYQSRGYSIPWDGTSNGGPVPVGTYYYTITGVALQEKIAGSVTVIR